MSNYKRVFQKGSTYFLTVVTHKRNPILIQNIDLLRDSFRQVKSEHSFEIEAMVVLHDHFHLLLQPEHAHEYSTIIKKVKRHFTVHCPPAFYQYLAQSPSRTRKGQKPVWQKRFYEHTIRDERDYDKHLDYIHFNPVKHGLVGRARDWQFSSFHKFVRRGWYDEDWYDINRDESNICE